MSLESGMREFFLSNSTVRGLIGARMFPHEAPEEAEKPYVAYRLTVNDEPRSLSGAVMSRKRVYELACCDESFESAKGLADAVKAVLTAPVSTTFDSTNVIVFWADSPENDGHVSAHDKIRYQVLLDLIVLIR